MQPFSELRLNTAGRIQEIRTIPCNSPRHPPFTPTSTTEHRRAARRASVVDLDVHTAKVAGLSGGMSLRQWACSAVLRLHLQAMHHRRRGDQVFFV
jgi:hypothetical protein